MRTKHETRQDAQYFADQRQAEVTLYAYLPYDADSPSNRYDYIETSRFERDGMADQYRALETVRPHYRTMENIRSRNQRLGHYWFAPDTMRFFSSRVHDRIYRRDQDGTAYFVSSERPPSGRRAYSVRRANPDGSVSTVGEILQYRTGKQAHAAAARFAEQGEDA